MAAFGFGAASSFGGAPGAGGFGAPGAGGFGAPAAAAAGGVALSSELPEALDMAVLDALEAALAGAQHDVGAEALKLALGADHGHLRALVDPFFKGFEQRRNLDEEIRRGGVVPQQAMIAAPPAAAGFGFGAQPSTAATAQPPPSTDEQLKLKIKTRFSFAQILEKKTDNPGTRAVAAAHAVSFSKVGLGNMKDKPIPAADIEPWLKLATEVATELRENLVRCLHLVLSAKRSAAAGVDDHALKVQAVRLYYSQQQRILTLICRLLTKREHHQHQPSRVGELCTLACDAVLLAAQAPTLVDRMCTAVRYNLERYTDGGRFFLDSASKLCTQKRKGLEMELRLLCEVLQERLRCASPASNPGLPETALSSVMSLYKDSFAPLLKNANSATDSKDACVVFYGTMLAAAISFALLEWGTVHHLDVQQSLLNWLQKDNQKLLKEWGGGGDMAVSATDLYGSSDVSRPLGYIQLVLACIPGQPLVQRKRFRELAVHNQALAFLDKTMLVSIGQDQWVEYRDRLARSCGVVLSKILDSQVELMGEIIRPDARYAEAPYPSDRYQMFIHFLGACGKVYSLHTGRSGGSGGVGGGVGAFDSSLQRGFENIRKHFNKMISTVESERYLYGIYGAWYELLASMLELRPDDIVVIRQEVGETLHGESLKVLLDLVDAEVFFQKGGHDNSFVHPDLLPHLETYADQLRNFVKLPEYSTETISKLATQYGNENLRKYCINDARRKLGAQSTSDGHALVHAGFYHQQDTDRAQTLEEDMIRYHRSWLLVLQALARSIVVFVRAGALGQHLPGYDRIDKLCQVSLRLSDAERGFEPLTPAWLLSDGGGMSYQRSRSQLERLGDLWLAVLPAGIKTEVVKEIEKLADYVIAAEEVGRGRPHDRFDRDTAQELQRIWSEFVCEKVMMRGVIEVPQNMQAEGRSDVFPFHYEFLLIERDLGRYEHTLAFLQLLHTLFKRHVPYNVEDSRVGEVIYNCIMLMPPAEGEQALFLSACDRWKLYSGVLRVIETVLLTLFDIMRNGVEDWRRHPACALLEQILQWIVLPESQTRVSLRSQVMDMLALGLQIAEESEDESELPHLASALEVALRVVHLAIFVCNSVEEYREACMLEAIIAERARVRPGGKRLRSLLVSIMCYVTLDDEPKLAWRALQLMQLICQHRDQDVFKVISSDMSEASREHVIIACADWLLQADTHHEVSRSIFDLILDSLARVEDEESMAHFLLGFTPYQPAQSELSRLCATTRLVQVLYDSCGEEGRWMANWNQMYGIRIAMEEEGDGGGGGGGEDVRDERQLMLLHMARHEHTLEIFYRLVAHAGTRDAALRLLLHSDAYAKWSGGIEEGSQQTKLGRLLQMADAIPIDDALQQGATVRQLREDIKSAWGGAGLESQPPQPPDTAPSQGLENEYWKGGKRDLSVEDAAEEWFHEQEQIAAQSSLRVDAIERCKSLRFDIDELENQLDDAQECLMNFCHQTGWFLQTVAILVHATREPLAGSITIARSTAYQVPKVLQPGDGRHTILSLEHAQHLFTVLFGSPESAGSGGMGGDRYPAAGLGTGELGGVPIWTRGKVQALLALAMDVPEMERDSSAALHELLQEEDLEECKTRVDRWSEGAVWMLDEKKLQQRLYARLVQVHAQAHTGEQLFAKAQSCIHRRVLGSYDGFNTVQRCRSAREHLLCGLQDVLEHVLAPVGTSAQPLLAHVLHLDKSQLTLFLFDMLALLRGAESLLTQTHVAGHLSRCISLVLAAITAPSLSRGDAQIGSADSTARAQLLHDLDFLLSVPAQTVASSGVTLRADLYSAILKLLQYLQLAGGGSGKLRDGMPGDLEMVVERHRADLFRVAVLDVASVSALKASAAEQRVEYESKATALAVIQMLLPQNGRGEGVGGGNGDGGTTMKGLLVHHNLVLHLTDDLLPGEDGTNLGEVLDVTKTEDKQPQLLMFNAKMAVLLRIAQDPEGMRELANSRIIYRLARSRYLLSHVQSEHHLRTLFRSNPRGPQTSGLLAKRLHLLLLPTLKLFLMLLHDVTDGLNITAAALEFLWAHRYLVREVLHVEQDDIGTMLGGGARGTGAMAQESDECIEERRLLLDALLVLERLGGFETTPSSVAAPSSPPGRGVQVKELDAVLTSATALLMRALLEETSTSSFWQSLDMSGVSQQGRAWANARAARRAMHMLQTCEIALRLYLARARRFAVATRLGGGEAKVDLQQDLLVFDCLSLLIGPAAANGVSGAGSSGFELKREHRVPVEPLIHFFCRCVEHLCGGGENVSELERTREGAGGSSGNGGATNGPAAPASVSGRGAWGGLTRSGAMTVWLRYKDSLMFQQQAGALNAGTRSPLATFESHAAVERLLVQLFRLCEVALSALVESLSLALAKRGSVAQDASAAFGAAGMRGGLLAHFGTQSCLDLVWNKQRTGAAQRLLVFVRQSAADDQHFDSGFIQGLTKRLFELVQLVQDGVD